MCHTFFLFPSSYTTRKGEEKQKRKRKKIDPVNNRVRQWLWTLLVMALDGNIIAMTNAGNPATVNYAMFSAAFSMVSLFYLFPASWNLDWSIHPILMVILDILNAIWFLTSGIALAARLECHSCSNRVSKSNFDFLHTQGWYSNDWVTDKNQQKQGYLERNEITNGSTHHKTKRCRLAQATVAFLWFAWFGYTISIVLSMIAASKFKWRGPRLWGRGRRPVRPPHMAQV